MKKLYVIVILILLTGCATTPETSCLQYHPQKEIINEIICSIAAYNNIPPPIYFCVLSEDIVNAWIDTEPCIYITTGLLNTIPDRNALSCVIAHEISHHVLRHGRIKQGIAIATTVVFMVTDFFVPGAGLLDHVVNPTITNAFSRSQELEADKKAVKLCLNAGMFDSKKQFIKMLEWLNTYEREPNFRLWATHPSIKDRIDNIREMD